MHPSTVSRVLNDRDAARVSDATAERIQRLAGELGYEPDSLARSLRLRRTMALGVVIPHLTDVVLAMMVEAVSEAAAEQGYQTITVSTWDQDGRQDTLTELLLDRQVDGLIIATAGMEDPLPGRLAERGVPFVLMNRRNDGFPAVAGDDEEGGRLATAHLIEQGHQRIGIVAGPQDVSTAAHRLSGYRRAHADAGMEVDEDLVAPSGFSPESGEEAARRLFQADDPPTALFAVNDFAALGCFAVIRDQGLTVPRDVALVGYNDIPIAASLPIPLTSVALPLEQIGRSAAAMLIDLIGGDAPDSLILPPRLRVRSSSLH